MMFTTFAKNPPLHYFALTDVNRLFPQHKISQQPKATVYRITTTVPTINNNKNARVGFHNSRVPLGWSMPSFTPV